MKRFTVYIDESGQDTKGELFVVGVVVTESERDILLQELLRIEQESGKKNIKWHKARHVFRVRYIQLVVQSPLFLRTMLFEMFHGSKQYLSMTSYATAKAILAKAGEREYRATIFVDGLNRREVALFKKELKALHIRKKKVRGVRRDENNAFIRC
jgi:hypothetical protein